MFNKGNLALKVQANKGVYFPGEEMKLKVEIMNESVKKVLYSFRSFSIPYLNATNNFSG